MDFNFKIGMGVEILYQGEAYDLHNCYYFTGFKIFGDENDCLRLEFSPHPKWGKGMPVLVLKFLRFDVLECCPGIRGATMDHMDEMGFKSPEDRDYDWLKSQKQYEIGDHFVFRFGNNENGEELRIHSKIAECLLGKELK